MRRNFLNQQTLNSWRASSGSAQNQLFFNRLSSLRGIRPSFFLASAGLLSGGMSAVKYFPVSSNGQNSRSFFSFLNFDLASLSGLLYFARLLAVVCCVLFVYYAVCVLSLWGYTYFAFFLYAESFCSVTFAVFLNMTAGIVLALFYYLVWYPIFLYCGLLEICYGFMGWLFFCAALLTLFVLLFFFCNFFFKLGMRALPFNPLSLLAPNATLSFLLTLSVFFFFNVVVLVSLGALLCVLYFFSNKSFFGKSVVHNDIFCGVISNLANLRVTGLSSYTFFFFNTLSNVTRSVDNLLRLKLSNFVSSLHYSNLRSRLLLRSEVTSNSRFCASRGVLAGLPHFRILTLTGAPLLQSYKTAYHVFFITSFLTASSAGQVCPQSPSAIGGHFHNFLVPSANTAAAVFLDVSSTAIFNLRGFTSLSEYSGMANQLANHWQLSSILRSERLVARAAGYSFASMHTNFKFNFNFLLKLRQDNLSAGNFYSSEPLTVAYSLADSYDVFDYNIAGRGIGAPHTAIPCVPTSGFVDHGPTTALFFHTNTNNLQYGQLTALAIDFRNYRQFGDKSWLNDACSLFY